TAALGEKAAFACTAAVEEVIDEHYAAQIEALKDQAPALAATVQDFRADEAAHRDTALAQGAEQAPGYKLLSEAIKTGCRIAIKLSDKISNSLSSPASANEVSAREGDPGISNGRTRKN